MVIKLDTSLVKSYLVTNCFCNWNQLIICKQLVYEEKDKVEGEEIEKNEYFSMSQK